MAVRADECNQSQKSIWQHDCECDLAFIQQIYKQEKLIFGTQYCHRQIPFLLKVLHTVKRPSADTGNMSILGTLLDQSNEWTGTNCITVQVSCEDLVLHFMYERCYTNKDLIIIIIVIRRLLILTWQMLYEKVFCVIGSQRLSIWLRSHPSLMLPTCNQITWDECL